MKFKLLIVLLFSIGLNASMPNLEISPLAHSFVQESNVNSVEMELDNETCTIFLRSILDEAKGKWLSELPKKITAIELAQSYMKVHDNLNFSEKSFIIGFGSDLVYEAAGFSLWEILQFPKALRHATIDFLFIYFALKENEHALFAFYEVIYDNFNVAKKPKIKSKL